VCANSRRWLGFFRFITPLCIIVAISKPDQRNRHQFQTPRKGNFMTKQIRIENADTSPYRVVVEIWDNGVEMPDGLGGINRAPDTLARTIELNHPTAMTDSSVYLTSTRYIVVREADAKHPA